MGKSIMDEVTKQFYIALPSNSSFNFFPNNTQSSYRTKLASPLKLDGDYECGLKEIFLPRNYFNIGDHNNNYSIVQHKEIEIEQQFMKYEVEFEHLSNESNSSLWEKINKNIERVTSENKSVHFVFDEKNTNVKLELKTGFEVFISENSASKMLFMLNLPNKDITITKSTTFSFRPSSLLKKQTFTIINRNPKSIRRNKIPIAPLNVGNEPKNINELAAVLNENINLLKLEKFIQVFSLPEENILRFIMQPNVKIRFKREDSEYFINAFNINDTYIYYDDQDFTLNEGTPIPVGGFINMTIEEYYTIKEIVKVTEDFLIDVGIYNTPQKLFETIKTVQLSQLPNSKVKMIVPSDTEINFGKGLRDMLGFVNINYNSGTYVSEYPLELDGGITELYVYTNIISAYHIGDTFAKCLCVIPCMSEKEDQIFRHYQTPLYFPVSQTFIESIDIDIKTASGNSVIFNGGKVYVLLSFRKRNL